MRQAHSSASQHPARRRTRCAAKLTACACVSSWRRIAPAAAWRHCPTSAIVKKTTHTILEKNGKDEQLELAMGLEERALKDDYFVQRKLYPNVDFYTGLIYRAMGFPTDFFTVLFAIGRLPGWIAQYREQLELNTKINRPRQIYTGYQQRDFVPRDQR